jgi:hypothetical protein
MYIIEANSRERETEAIRHLAGSPLKDEVLGAFGFDALNFVIVEAWNEAHTRRSREIDILVGNLDFKHWADYLSALSETGTQSSLIAI